MEEKEKIRLFFTLMLEQSFPIRILICLREEFLGKLSYLEQYIPHLYRYKVSLDHPDEEVIRDIITRSFEVFNINQ